MPRKPFNPKEFCDAKVPHDLETLRSFANEDFPTGFFPKDANPFAPLVNAQNIYDYLHKFYNQLEPIRNLFIFEYLKKDEENLAEFLPDGVRLGNNTLIASFRKANDTNNPEIFLSYLQIPDAIINPRITREYKFDFAKNTHDMVKLLEALDNSELGNITPDNYEVLKRGATIIREASRIYPALERYCSQNQIGETVMPKFNEEFTAVLEAISTKLEKQIEAAIPRNSGAQGKLTLF